MGKLIVLNRQTKEYDYFIKYKRNRIKDEYTLELFYSHSSDWTNPGSKILTLKEDDLIFGFKFEDKVDLKKSPYYIKDHMEIAFLALDAVSVSDKVKRKSKNRSFKIFKL